MAFYNNVIAGAAGASGADYTIQRSLRFNKPDGAHLDRTPSSQGNRRKFTWSGWVKRNELDSAGEDCLFSAGNNPWFDITFRNDQLTSVTNAGVGGVGTRTEAKFRDTSAWYHVVCVVNTEESTANDRIKFWVNGVRQTTTANGSDGYPAQNSDNIVNTTIAHRIGADGRVSGGGIRHANIQLAEIHFLDGTAISDPDGVFGEFDATTGVWNPIEYSGTYGTNGFYLDFSNTSSNAALGYDAAGSNNWTVNNIVASSSNAQSITSVTFTGNNVSGNRIREFFLGTTSVTSSVYTTFSSNISQYDSGHNSGYLPNAHDGNESTNIDWKYGTLSYTFTNKSAAYVDLIGSISSGGNIIINGTTYNAPFPVVGTSSGGNDIRRIYLVDPVNVDSLIDSPTNYEAESGNNGGNYATLNPIATNNVVYENGNLHARKGSGTGWSVAVSNFGMTTGKWYCEITNQAGITHQIGIVKLDEAVLLGSNVPIVDYTWGWGFINDGVGLRLRSDLFGGGNSTDAAFGATGSNYVAGDTIGLAYDADNQEFSIYKNGTLVGNTTSSWTNAPTPGTYAFAISLNASNAAVDFNFGQRPFAYTPPTNHKSLCTQNLLDPVVDNPATGFDVVKYAGNSGTQNITGLKFSPDFVWIKARNHTSGHALYDRIRGESKIINSNTTGAEADQGGNGLTGFNSNGFTVKDVANGGYGVNGNYNYVGWAWDAGDAANATSISAGGLNSSVYNQSQTWSNDLVSDNGNYFGTHTPAKAFDGDITSTKCTSSSAPGTLTLDLSNNNLTGTLEVLAYTGMSIAVTHSGGTTTIAGGTSSANFGSLTSISQIVVTGVSSSYNAQLFGIKLNGALLVDSGVSVTNVPSVASTVRANTSCGFSIVSYTGTGTASTIGHGLNAAPELFIIKNRDSTYQWPVYFKVNGAGNKLYLDATAAKGSTNHFNSTEPTSLVFSVGGTSSANNNGNDLIAYCFAPVEGYSAFGSYTGNGSADGPFVYTGFRPRWVMHKRSDSGGTNVGDWRIWDTERDVDNAAEDLAIPNNTTGGTTSAAHGLDILSNGFKFRTSDSNINGSGGTYVYAAFAENPFKTARAR